MGTPLAYLYSSIDSAKRKVLDALTNPMDTLRNVVDDKNLAAREHLQQLAGSGPVTGPQNPEQAQNLAAVVDTLASGYSPAGILAGPRAKGIDNIALAYAMKDARAGRKPADTWAERNWAKGPDGFWRTEIDDSVSGPILRAPSEWDVTRWGLPSGFRAGAGGSMGPLDLSFKHDALKKAYPDVWANSTADVRVDPGAATVQGSFSRFGGNIPGGDIRAKDISVNGLRSTVLHELQHAVQAKEGFQGGGNPGMFKINDPREAFKLYQRLSGEAEARLVESRRNLAPEARRQIFPYDPGYFQQSTQVPLDSLILPPALK